MSGTPSALDLGSEAQLRSDLPLDGFDLEAATDIIKQNESHGVRQESEPSKDASPSTKKVESLRADISKVPMNFEPAHKKFARPSSAGLHSEQRDLSTFTFGQPSRNAGNLSRPRKPHEVEQSQQPPQPKDSAHTIVTTPQESTHEQNKGNGGIDTSHVNVMPLSMDKSSQAGSASRNGQIKEVVEEKGDRKVYGRGRREPDFSADKDDAKRSNEQQKCQTKSVNGTSIKQNADSTHRGCPSKSSASSLNTGAPNQAETTNIEPCHRDENINNDSSNTLRTASEQNHSGAKNNMAQAKDHHLQGSSMAGHRSGHKVQDSARVTKTRPLNPSFSGNSRRIDESLSGSTAEISEDDLFMLLMQRNRDHKASKVRAAGKQREMAQTIHGLCRDNQEYRKALKLCEEAKQAHVSMVDEQKTINEDLKVRFGKLKAFVNGLSSDFDSFRKDGQTIRKTYEETERARCNLLDDLEGHHSRLAAADRSVAAIQTTVSGLKGNIEALKSTANQLDAANSQLRGQGEQLQQEKMKAIQLESRLQTEIKCLRQQDENLRGDYHDVADRLTLLPPLMESVQNRITMLSESPPELTQCLRKIEEMAKITDKTPTDFAKIVAALNTQAERIVACLHETTLSVNRQNASHDNESEDALDHLKTILTTIKDQAASHDDFARIEEAKHKLEERLAETKEAIKSKDSEISGLAAREKVLWDTLPQLRTEIQAFKDNCSPATKQLEHYRSQADQNRISMMWANSEKAEALNRLAAVQEDTRTKESLLADAEKEIEGLKMQQSTLGNRLEEVEKDLRTYDKEEIACNKQKVTEQDELIHRLNGQIERANTTNHSYCQEIQDLQAIRASMEEEINSLTIQLKTLRDNMSTYEADNDRLRKDVGDLHAARTEAANVPILKEELSKKERDILGLRSETEQVGQQKQQIKVLEADKAHLDREIVQMGKQIADQRGLQETIERLEEALQQTEAKAALLQTSLKSTENKANRINALEAVVASKDEALRDIRAKYDNASQALEQLDSLRLEYDEISERHKELKNENAGLIEVSAENERLRTSLTDKENELENSKDYYRQLQRLEEENTRKDAQLRQLEAESRRKDEEQDNLRADLMKNEELTLDLSKKISQINQMSQDSVWSENMLAAIDSITEPPRRGAASNLIETPVRITDLNVEGDQQPDTPEAPRHRQIANRHVLIPESSVAVKERLAAAVARLSDGSQAAGTAEITRIPESQPNAKNIEELEEDLDSELSDAPESSPIKKHRPSLFANRSTEPNASDIIDDIPPQILLGAKQKRSQNLRASSSSSRPSTQGEEMLLERQLQKHTPNRTFRSYAHDTTLLQEPASNATETRFTTPAPPSPAGRRLQYGKAAVAGQANPQFAIPDGPSPRRPRTMTYSAPQVVDPITDSTPAPHEGTASLEAPAAGILKQKHQPNTGAKRQLDSDSVAGSPQTGPNKIAKRNPSDLEVRKQSSGLGKSPNFNDLATREGRSPDLPAGGKKGSVGGRSNQTGAKPKAAKKPRKGSRGDQYGNRFGKSLQ